MYEELERERRDGHFYREKGKRSGRPWTLDGLSMGLGPLYLIKGFAAILAVLNTRASQSRQHDTLVGLPMDIRLKIDLGKSVGSHKSPTMSLFDVGSSRISIFTVNTCVSLGCSGNITRIKRRTLKILLVITVVWGFVGDVGSESLRPSDVSLLLVAFDSRLKIFHPLLNDNTSGEHPSCVFPAQASTFQLLEVVVDEV
ncbi:hypothetical protein Tco_1188628, partial [Tanacetum coccineum]